MYVEKVGRWRKGVNFVEVTGFNNRLWWVTRCIVGEIYKDEYGYILYF